MLLNNVFHLFGQDAENRIIELEDISAGTVILFTDVFKDFPIQSKFLALLERLAIGETAAVFIDMMCRGVDVDDNKNAFVFLFVLLSS